MTSALAWAIVILVVGLVLLVAETFIPSGGILGILAATALVGSIFLAFTQGRVPGTIFLIVVIIALPTAFAAGMHVWPRTPFGRWMSLAGPAPEDVQPGRVAEKRLDTLVGRVGRTVTPLRPSGITDFDGERVDTIADGFLVEPGTLVRVIAVQGNRVLVRAIESEER